MNPYAAPQAAAPLPAGVPPQGEPQPWDVGEVLRIAWDLFKANWAAFSFGTFVALLVGMLPSQVAPGLAAAGILEQQSGAYWGVHVPLMLVGYLIQGFFAVGLARMALNASRTGMCSFGDAFSGGSRFLPYMGMWFLAMFGISLGLVVFIVPGVILALGLWMGRWYLVDQQLGPIEALKASWTATDGHKGNLFLLYLLGGLLGVAGAMACCVGIFPAQAVILLAEAIVYQRLSGTTGSGPAASPYASAAAYPAPPPPMPPGYGPPGAPYGGGYGGPPGGGGYGPPGGGFGGPPA